ncbi:MAG: efflux RND transporter periplasmic adaptor subunit [Paludibacteraceae bacterium]|nr:efflux RND transporter periplasmic adaptor subunit [Paludibacteraceae bacterium]
MKKFIFYITLITLLMSCSGKKGQADAYGNFETDEVIVSAENNGKITEAPVNEGDVVKAGTTLAVSDTVNLYLQKQQLISQKTSTEAQKATLKSQIAISDQQISNVNKDLQRIKKMIVDGAATQKQLDDVTGQIALANKQKSAYSSQITAVQKQSDAVQSQIKVLEDKIKSSVITAPIDGTILEKYCEKGELAVPNKALYKMANIQYLNLRVYVSETQLPQIKIGQQVKVQIDDEKGSKNFTGNITWISSQAEFTPKVIQTKDERVKLVYAIKIRVKNDGTLKIGMPGEIMFN